MTDTQRGTVSIDQLAGLEYRLIGPHRGGRVVAVTGHPTEEMTFYFGACAGGVWKSTDGGTVWENISDGYLKTAAVGAIAISESDPSVLYVGMGETTIRGNVAHGDGVYRSTDGGRSWQQRGLAETRHIAKVRIHPTNPDLVYVAALGHAWGPNKERGIYRSRDGGENWEQILFRSERAGAIDLSLDPHNPRILYAAFWEAQRTPYSMWSGGEGSGLYRSTDGGDTWEEITRNPGLPTGVLGKIGVAVSPAKAGRVWALIEAEEGALFRSDDGGDTWKVVSDNPDLRRRAWYYMHVFADPQDADVVWVNNLSCWKSIDGGKTFFSVPTPHGDNHDLWIDPKNPNRMIEGNDGGACVSFNGGRTWSTILNQPTAQFYHVTADNEPMYRVYGSQQDNTAITVPSNSPVGAITEQEWFTPGGGESGYIAVRPDDPNIQYAGDHHGLLTRHDRRTGQKRVITVWPNNTVMYEGAGEQKYRFNWTYPIFLSPFDPHTLYVAAQCLLRSRDEGESWEEVSPDLTHPEPHMLASSGGPITLDNTSAEFYGTIFAAVESPHEQGTFWVGSDDGLVHLSRDNGQTWQNITPPDLPEWSLISIIEVSPHDPATAYLAATRYKLDDPRPYLFKTIDYGQTWTQITTGIPADDFTRVIREDPQCRGLLFAGTEEGLYLSFDDGAQWERFNTNLPLCPIHDLIIHDNDLVVGTHGRSFWILDDLTPLHEIARDRSAQNRLFTPEDTIRFKIYEGYSGGEGEYEYVGYRMAGAVTYGFRLKEKPDGTKEQVLVNAGKNRPNGAIISYFLAEKPEGEITLRILDGQGNEITTYSSKKDEKPKAQESGAAKAVEMEAEEARESPEADPGERMLAEEAGEEEEQGPFLPKEAGLNRFVWNLRAANATRIGTDMFSRFMTAGPVVPPGEYTVELRVGGETYTASFRVQKDPRVDVSQEALEEQYALGLKIRDTTSAMNDAILEIRDVREQLKGWDQRLSRQENGQETRTQGKTLQDALTAVEEELINTKQTGRMPYPPPNVPTRLGQRLASLNGVVGSADARPTKQAYGVFDELNEQIQAQLETFRRLMERDLPAFNQAVQNLHVPAVVRKTGSKQPVAAGA